MAEVGEGLAEGAEVKGSRVQGTPEVEKARCGQSRETPGRGGEGLQGQKCRASRPRQEHAEGDGEPQVSLTRQDSQLPVWKTLPSRMERGCTERRGRDEGVRGQP